MTVRNFLDLSTGHLKPETREFMREGGDHNVTMSGTYGWLVYLSEGDYEVTWDQDMTDCMTKARELGCLYILFDQDADRRDDLPYYE